jgi:uncharacterized protein YbaP (TraB family)
MLLSANQLQAQDKTLLFSIKGNGVKTSYIFGTVHIISDSAYYFPAKLEKLQEKSDVLVLEIDDLSDRAKMQDLLTLDSGTVFDLFSSEQTDSVVTWGSHLLNMKPEVFRSTFEKMKPFVLIQIAIQATMNAHSKSYEMDLMSKANSRKQPIKGLETFESQIAIFDNMEDSIMIEMIMNGIRNPEEVVEMQHKLTQLYMQKDMDGLAKLITESPDMGGNAEAMIYRRNRNWIPVMSNYMKTSSCFFAVGAGHLGGEQGVIQLLRNAGYTVTPIQY